MVRANFARVVVDSTRLEALESKALKASEYALVAANEMTAETEKIRRASHGIRELRRKISSKIPSVQIPAVAPEMEDLEAECESE